MSALRCQRARRISATVALAAVAAAACSGPTEVVITSLAGDWFARDTFAVQYRGDDGLAHMFSAANAYPVRVVALTDSTYTFQVTGGIQTQTASTPGGTTHTDTVTDIEMDGMIHVRRDTAFIELLGRLPLRSSSNRVLDSRRVLSDSECSEQLGPAIPRSPPPGCTESHHWSR